MNKGTAVKILGFVILATALWQGTAAAQFLASGVFTDQYGADHYWYVNSSKRLIYDDEEFICVNGSNGVYFCRWDSAWETELNELKEDTPINEIISFGLNQDVIRCELKDYINCIYTDHGFSNDGGLGKPSRLLTILKSACLDRPTVSSQTAWKSVVCCFAKPRWNSLSSVMRITASRPRRRCNQWITPSCAKTTLGCLCSKNAAPR